MSLLSKLFGGGKKSAAPEAEAEEYQGFRIVPGPIAEGQQYRVAARIEKEIDGETKVHQLIRADTIAGYDEAVKTSAAKARQMIDEQGERIFR